MDLQKPKNSKKKKKKTRCGFKMNLRREQIDVDVLSKFIFSCVVRV